MDARLEDAELSAQLDLSELSLRQIPDKVFTEFTHIITLDVKRNQLTSLPDSLGELSGLEELVLTRNKIATLPPSLGTLKDLRTLVLGSNPSPSFTCTLESLSVLATLDLSNCLLSSVPQEVFSLPALRELNLFKNDLTVLPPQIGRLKTLNHLNISQNKIACLPTSLLELEDLNNLEADGNPLTNPPADVVDRGVSAVKQFLRESATEASVDLQRTHVDHTPLAHVLAGGTVVTMVTCKTSDGLQVSEGGEDVNAFLRTAEGENGCLVVDRLNGTYLVSFIATSKGDATLHVTINGTEIPDSNIAMNILPGPVVLSSSLVQIPQSGFVNNQIAIPIFFCDKFGNRVTSDEPSILASNPDGDFVDTRCKETEEGFEVSFIPETVGAFIFALSDSSGAPIASSPYTITVSALPGPSESEIKETQAKLEQIPILESRVSELTEETAQMQEEAKKKKSLIEEHTNKIHEIETSNAEEVRQLTEARDTLQLSEASLQSNVQSLEAKVDELEKRNTELKESKLAEASDEQKVDEAREELVKKRAELEEEVKTLQEEKESVTNQQKKNEEEASKLEEEKKKMEEEKTKLQEEKEELEGEKSRIEEVKKTMEEEKNGIAEEKMKLEQEKEEVENLQKELTEEKIQEDKKALGDAEVLLKEDSATVAQEKAELEATKVEKEEEKVEEKVEEIEEEKEEEQAKMKEDQENATEADEKTKFEEEKAKLAEERKQFEEEKQKFEEEKKEFMVARRVSVDTPPSKRPVPRMEGYITNASPLRPPSKNETLPEDAPEWMVTLEQCCGKADKESRRRVQEVRDSVNPSGLTFAQKTFLYSHLS